MSSIDFLEQDNFKLLSFKVQLEHLSCSIMARKQILKDFVILCLVQCFLFFVWKLRL